MDYKKKYEEALERAKGLYEQGIMKIEKCVAWLEKQREQKSTDKVEPKFKNGQWIVWQDKCYKVNYNGCGYELVDQNGLNTSLEYGTIDKNAHLWTIQNAKDGDVLADNYSIIIFRNIVNHVWNDVIDFYVGYNHGSTKINIQSDDSHYGNINTTLFKPATKEQCDLLFQKMKEAGYERDAERNELKKIEQKPICKLDNSHAHVIFPFKAKVKSSGKIVTICGGQLSSDGKEWIKYQSDIEDGYKVYEPNSLELVHEIEQNSAWSDWSKEDERMIRRICYYLNEFGNWLSDKNEEKSLSIYKACDWLKSLKERMKE